MPAPAKQTNPLSLVGGLVGAAAGWTLSSYCGAMIWLPGIALVLLLLIFAKTPLHPRYFAGAIATTLAHLAWFVAGGIFTGNLATVALDLVVLGAGVAWLWARPGPGSALFLGVVQSLALVWNAAQLVAAPFGSTPHRALTVHCTFRLLALICLVAGYLRLRRERLVPPPFPESVLP